MDFLGSGRPPLIFKLLYLKCNFMLGFICLNNYPHLVWVASGFWINVFDKSFAQTSYT